MSTTTLKDARMELKTTSDAKDLLAQAAALNGMDLTSFVLGPAIEKARAVLSSHATISLSKKGQEALAGLLENPPAPTTAMKDLMSMPDLPPRKIARKA
jgi:uncharacterized protein (DUF1778 family)